MDEPHAGSPEMRHAMGLARACAGKAGDRLHGHAIRLFERAQALIR
ncbi:hypothetical protein NUH86_07015 [Sphingobium sp. JS3065]|nr:hypothetical protein [Sphingobium sp. JS3065]UZW56506.1 hypothetical protein NUH86_07015 [Sphingobium sp. JS3065]